MSDRLNKLFGTLRQQGEKAMGLFLTDGFPNPSATLPLLQTIDKAGADFIELGMPFSDPLAEGLPIQRSSSQALSHGVSLEDTLQTAADFRQQSNTPLLLMGYYNPILQYGIKAFCEKASSAGVDGLILADLPVEESEDLANAAEETDLKLVYLVAPNTPDARVQAIDQRASAFVYAVSVTGLTGSSIDTDPVINYLKHVRGLVTQNPLLVGFGIQSHEDAMFLSEPTDGFIVGSKLITTIETLWEDSSLSTKERLSAVSDFVSSLKYGATLPS